MTGIVSGRARVAAIIDPAGNEVHALLHGDESGWRRILLLDLLGLLGDVDDLRSVANAKPEYLASELDRAVRSEQVSWLLLILLDRDRSFEIREEASAILHRWLRERRELAEALRERMVTRLLPADADISGAFHACEHRNAHAAWDLLREIENSQPQTMRLVPYASAAPNALSSHPQRQMRELFSGTPESFDAWKMEGRGRFALVDRTMVALPGGDLGLLYFPEPFDDFSLELEFLLTSPNDACSVFVRFRDPRLPVPLRGYAGVAHEYMNRAWVAVRTGVEIKVEPEAVGFFVDGALSQPLDSSRQERSYPVFRPIANVSTRGPDSALWPPPVPPYQWHRLVVSAFRDAYSVEIDGLLGPTFFNVDGYRGRSHREDPASGFVGLQAGRGNVAYSSIRLLLS